ncbi:hypothetical protein COB64_01505 [Candidatus Wolfebacteria bacterium]|nr:MAG: hypothetical protein COB64_01505 [Candidatus Wolfebacteria bacterium]
MKQKILKIPDEVINITETLEDAGFEAYLVGGCVRDLLRNKEPKDWDITTNAKPEQIEALFEKTVYENTFGTVVVVQEDVIRETLRNIEVTPYRLEAKYSDNRHPDSVSFSDNIEDDLKRRDFTINAIAYSPSKGHIIDLYKGQEDIKDKIIRAVGDPEERFTEDALRIVRAIRFSAELGFTIEEQTEKAITKTANLLENIAMERIKDEFSKMVMSENPMDGMILINKLNVLKYILPESGEGIKIEQNASHIYDVWEHSIRALQHGAKREFPLHVRIAALLHDVGKPRSRAWSKEKKDYTFYGHEVIGARMTKKALERLKFPRKIIDTATKLVRNHMFFSDIDQITLSAVRRLIRNVGKENVWDLMKVRACDRIGMGKPKEAPYRLRKYKSMIEEAMRAPVSVGMLKIDGDIIMKITGEKPSRKIGYILHSLLEEVLDDPELNTEEYLERKSKELIKLPEDALKTLGEAGREKKEEEEEKELAKIRKRHFVK